MTHPLGTIVPNGSGLHRKRPPHDNSCSFEEEA